MIFTCVFICVCLGEEGGNLGARHQNAAHSCICKSERRCLARQPAPLNGLIHHSILSWLMHLYLLLWPYDMINVWLKETLMEVELGHFSIYIQKQLQMDYSLCIVFFFSCLEFGALGFWVHVIFKYRHCCWGLCYSVVGQWYYHCEIPSAKDDETL